MKSTESLEEQIIACIFNKEALINELFIDEKCFQNPQNRKIINFLKKEYKERKTLDYQIIYQDFPTEERQMNFLKYYSRIIDEYIPIASNFYSYQERLQESYRDIQIDNLIKKYDNHLIEREELINKIREIDNENLYLKKKNNKKTPEEMLKIIRTTEKQIKFDRLNKINSKLYLKENTINVIAARPSEGKSALALNMFCDLSKNYKCLYFNLEMTEPEIYERMLGIESSIPIENIKEPKTNYQNEKIKEYASKIYNYNYEVVNGSKSINSIMTKIIKEQREEHLIVFIDYIGYVTSKYGMSDKDRIGEITRELNNLTKDYNCTIFIVAQINRSGTDNPTMEDLKDSGELEQSADTIILINDPDKQNNESTKDINLLIPKCRGAKRNFGLKVRYFKESQQMEVL